MTNPSLTAGFDTPFQEQVDFFRQKLNLPTEAWDDIWQEAHDRAFVVAGATKADLLDDLRQAVDKAISRGTTLETFRKDFRQIVAKHGWQGWTGEGTPGGFAWRTRVIYETNLRSSYAAGRWQQLNDPGLAKLMPYWRYVHNESVLHPRPQHQAWGASRLTLPRDHPFWKTHFPPNGWGCRCRVTAAPAPRQGDATEPPEGWDVPDETGKLPGIDKGWGYAPGANARAPLKTLIDQKLVNLDAPLGAALHESMAPLLAMERQQQWWRTLDEWQADPMPRGRTEILGALQPSVIDWLRKNGFALPDSAEVAIEDRLVIGAKQKRHERAQNALMPEEWRTLTKLVGDPSAVYLHKQTGHLIFVGDGIGPEKAAVEFATTGKRSPLNLVDTAFRVSALDVAGAVKGGQWVVITQ